jgi:UDP-N-acetylenolpyruvoylglucosamine reductase
MEIRYRHVPLLEENFAVSAVFRGKSQRRQKSSGDWKNRRKNAAPPNRAQRVQVASSKIRARARQEAVDELGLKGLRVGDAVVSEVHGNFIVNEGNATAAEVLELIAKIQAIARAKRGDELETEVQIVGEDAY